MYIRTTSIFTALFIGALTLVGCPSPNTYGTARTVPVGEFQHTIALEAIGAAGNDTNVFTPTLPTYQFRVGVADSVDLGVRLANLTSLGVDAKFNFLRGTLDLAIAPGLQAAYISSDDASVGLVYGNLPLIIGVNISESFGLIATPGIGFALATASLEGEKDSVNASGNSFLLRMGIGANIKFMDGFGLQPEVTMLINPETSGVIYTAGIGFQFGTLPDQSNGPQPL